MFIYPYLPSFSFLNSGPSSSLALSALSVSISLEGVFILFILAPPAAFIESTCVDVSLSFAPNGDFKKSNIYYPFLVFYIVIS